MDVPRDKRGLSHGGRVREEPTRKPITESIRFRSRGRAAAPAPMGSGMIGAAGIRPVTKEHCGILTASCARRRPLVFAVRSGVARDLGRTAHPAAIAHPVAVGHARGRGGMDRRCRGLRSRAGCRRSRRPARHPARGRAVRPHPLAISSAAFTALIADQLTELRGAASAVVGSTQAVGLIVGVGTIALLDLDITPATSYSRRSSPCPAPPRRCSFPIRTATSSFRRGTSPAPRAGRCCATATSHGCWAAASPTTSATRSARRCCS